MELTPLQKDFLQKFFQTHLLLPALPEVLKPFKKEEFVEFFRTLSKELFQKLKPENEL